MIQKNEYFFNGLDGWVAVDYNNLPSGLVLAANFDKKCFYYGEQLIGQLFISIFGNRVGVKDNLAPDNMCIKIDNITHYIKL